MDTSNADSQAGDSGGDKVNGLDAPVADSNTVNVNMEEHSEDPLGIEIEGYKVFCNTDFDDEGDDAEGQEEMEVEDNVESTEDGGELTFKIGNVCSLTDASELQIDFGEDKEEESQQKEEENKEKEDKSKEPAQKVTPSVPQPAPATSSIQDKPADVVKYWTPNENYYQSPKKVPDVSIPVQLVQNQTLPGTTVQLGQSGTTVILPAGPQPVIAPVVQQTMTPVTPQRTASQTLRPASPGVATTPNTLNKNTAAPQIICIPPGVSFAGRVHSKPTYYTVQGSQGAISKMLADSGLKLSNQKTTVSQQAIAPAPIPAPAPAPLITPIQNQLPTPSQTIMVQSFTQGIGSAGGQMVTLPAGVPQLQSGIPPVQTGVAPVQYSNQPVGTVPSIAPVPAISTTQSSTSSATSDGKGLNTDQLKELVNAVMNNKQSNQGSTNSGKARPIILGGSKQVSESKVISVNTLQKQEISTVRVLGTLKNFDYLIAELMAYPYGIDPNDLAPNKAVTGLVSYVTIGDGKVAEHYWCNNCEFNSLIRREFVTHVAKHAMPFSCKKCKKFFKDRVQYFNHNAYHHQDSKTVRDYSMCAWDFIDTAESVRASLEKRTTDIDKRQKTVNELLSENKKNQKQTAQKNPTSQAPKATKSNNPAKPSYWKYVTDELAKAIEFVMDFDYKRSIFRCKACLYSSDKYAGNVKTHVREQVTFTCTSCGTVFRKEDNMVEHMVERHYNLDFEIFQHYHNFRVSPVAKKYWESIEEEESRAPAKQPEIVSSAASQTPANPAPSASSSLFKTYAPSTTTSSAQLPVTSITVGPKYKILPSSAPQNKPPDQMSPIVTKSWKSILQGEEKGSDTTAAKTDRVDSADVQCPIKIKTEPLDDGQYGGMQVPVAAEPEKSVISPAKRQVQRARKQSVPRKAADESSSSDVDDNDNQNEEEDEDEEKDPFTGEIPIYDAITGEPLAPSLREEMVSLEDNEKADEVNQLENKKKGSKALKEGVSPKKIKIEKSPKKKIESSALPWTPPADFSYPQKMSCFYCMYRARSFGPCKAHLQVKHADSVPVLIDLQAQVYGKKFKMLLCSEEHCKYYVLGKEGFSDMLNHIEEYKHGIGEKFEKYVRQKLGLAVPDEMPKLDLNAVPAAKTQDTSPKTQDTLPKTSAESVDVPDVYSRFIHSVNTLETNLLTNGKSWECYKTTHYACTICGYKNVNVSNLKAHLIMKHEAEIDKAKNDKSKGQPSTEQVKVLTKYNKVMVRNIEESVENKESSEKMDMEVTPSSDQVNRDEESNNESTDTALEPDERKPENEDLVMEDVGEKTQDGESQDGNVSDDIGNYPESESEDSSLMDNDDDREGVTEKVKQKRVRHRKNHPQTYRCGFCPYSGDAFEDVRAHVLQKTCHNSLNYVIINEKLEKQRKSKYMWLCSTCPFFTHVKELYEAHVHNSGSCPITSEEVEELPQPRVKNQVEKSSSPQLNEQDKRKDDNEFTEDEPYRCTYCSGPMKPLGLDGVKDHLQEKHPTRLPLVKDLKAWKMHKASKMYLCREKGCGFVDRDLMALKFHLINQPSHGNNFKYGTLSTIMLSKESPRNAGSKTPNTDTNSEDSDIPVLEKQDSSVVVKEVDTKKYYSKYKDVKSSADGPFYCLRCNMSSAEKMDVKEHNLVDHPGLRVIFCVVTKKGKRANVYMCDHSGCTYASFKSGSLKHHNHIYAYEYLIKPEPVDSPIQDAVDTSLNMSDTTGVLAGASADFDDDTPLSSIINHSLLAGAKTGNKKEKTTGNKKEKTAKDKKQENVTKDKEKIPVKKKEKRKWKTKHERLWKLSHIYKCYYGENCTFRTDQDEAMKTHFNESHPDGLYMSVLDETARHNKQRALFLLCPKEDCKYMGSDENCIREHLEFIHSLHSTHVKKEPRSPSQSPPETRSRSQTPQETGSLSQSPPETRSQSQSPLETRSGSQTPPEHRSRSQSPPEARSRSQSPSEDRTPPHASPELRTDDEETERQTSPEEKKTTSKYYQCSYCANIMTDYEAVKAHMSKEHEGMEPMYQELYAGLDNEGGTFMHVRSSSVSRSPCESRASPNRKHARSSTKRHRNKRSNVEEEPTKYDSGDEEMVSKQSDFIDSEDEFKRKKERSSSSSKKKKKKKHKKERRRERRLRSVESGGGGIKLCIKNGKVRTSVSSEVNADLSHETEPPEMDVGEVKILDLQDLMSDNDDMNTSSSFDIHMNSGLTKDKDKENVVDSDSESKSSRTRKRKLSFSSSDKIFSKSRRSNESPSPTGYYRRQSSESNEYYSNEDLSEQNTPGHSDNESVKSGPSQRSVGSERSGHQNSPVYINAESNQTECHSDITGSPRKNSTYGNASDIHVDASKTENRSASSNITDESDHNEDDEDRHSNIGDSHTDDHDDCHSNVSDVESYRSDSSHARSRKHNIKNTAHGSESNHENKSNISDNIDDTDNEMHSENETAMESGCESDQRSTQQSDVEQGKFRSSRVSTSSQSVVDDHEKSDASVSRSPSNHDDRSRSISGNSGSENESVSGISEDESDSQCSKPKYTSKNQEYPTLSPANAYRTVDKHTRNAGSYEGEGQSDFSDTEPPDLSGWSSG